MPLLAHSTDAKLQNKKRKKHTLLQQSRTQCEPSDCFCTKKPHKSPNQKTLRLQNQAQQAQKKPKVARVFQKA